MKGEKILRRLWVLLPLIALSFLASGCTSALMGISQDSSSQTGYGAHRNVPFTTFNASLSGPPSVAFGSSFTITLHISNVGRASAYNGYALLSLSGGLTTDANYVSLGTLRGGESKDFNITLNAPATTDHKGATISGYVTFSNMATGQGIINTAPVEGISVIYHALDETLVTVVLQTPQASVRNGVISVYDGNGAKFTTAASYDNQFAFNLKPGTYSFSGAGENSMGTDLTGSKFKLPVGHQDTYIPVYICTTQAQDVCEYLNNGAR
jgi:hypothetical protein